MQNTVKIIGTGSYIPHGVTHNERFKDQVFLNTDGTHIPAPNAEIIEKFKAITGIHERRYITDDLVNSDIAYFAAKNAIASAQIDANELDYLIVAHNYGDIKYGSVQSDTVPSLASRVKHLLKIENPQCVAYDMLFGCPGWLESVIHAQAFIKSGMAQKCLVIGSETLSRVVDKYDRDSMIYSDGAGAVVLEAGTTSANEGILAHHTATYTKNEAHFIYFGTSYNKTEKDNTHYIKMYGRKVYNFALSHVPIAMKTCLEKSGIHIDEIKKILIHQANEKMDEAIGERFYKLYDKPMPHDIMPMSIKNLGNSSVATIPTLLDLLLKGGIEDHSVAPGDCILFASVGAGMNINAMVYRL